MQRVGSSSSLFVFTLPLGIRNPNTHPPKTRGTRVSCVRRFLEETPFYFAVIYCSGILANDACAQSNHPNSGRPTRLLQMSPAKSRPNGEPDVVLPISQQIGEQMSIYPVH